MKNNSTMLAVLAAAGFWAHTLHAEADYRSVITNDAPLLYWNFDEPSGNAREVMPIAIPATINDLVPVNGAARVSHAALGDGLNLGNAASIALGSYFWVRQFALPTNAIGAPWLLEFWMQVQGSLDFQRNNYLMNFGGPAFGGNAPAVLYDYVGGAQPREGLELFARGTRTGAGPVINDQDWHHIVFAYYGDGASGVADRLDIYVDGTNAAQNVRATFSSAISLATRFVVGTSGPEFAANDGFEGNLDEIALYALAPTNTEEQVTSKAAQVASGHYALAHTAQSYKEGVLAEQPLLYWNFDEADGNAAQLAPVPPVVVQNDLTPNGPATRVSHAATHSGLRLGNAAGFTPGGYFAIGQLVLPTDSIAAPWVLEFWMQALGDVTTHPRYDYLLNFGNNAPAALYDYNGANTNGGLELYRGGNITGFGPGIEDQRWHHVMFVYYGDGSSGVADRLDIYFDGTNAAQNVRAAFSSSLTLSSLVVGTSGGQFAAADGFEGNMDELALYDLSKLSTEEAVTTAASDMAARHFAAAQQPYLEMNRIDSGLLLSWGASASGFVLESTTNLTDGAWSPVSVTPILTNGTAQVSLLASNQARYYRLRR